MSPARLASTAFAALVAAAGAWVGTQALAIGAAGGYSPVGPQFFPALVGAVLAAIGLVCVARAWRGADRHDAVGAADPVDPALAQADQVPAAAPVDADDGTPHRAALVWLSAAMLLGALLMQRAGFVIAMALAFLLASRAFTAHPASTLLRDAAVAVLTAVAVQVLFAYGLGLRLPAGPLGF